jgi:hypothetical protein
MICLSTNKCTHTDCKVSANFNYPGIIRAIYCTKHKKDGMINVTGKKCEHAGCLVSPSFNIPSEKRGRFCAEHKRDGMLNVLIPRCIEAGCSISPTYGNIGTTKALYCVTHKKPDMIVVVKCRTCQIDGCKTRASYGTGGVRTHCGKHKTDEMISLNGIRCMLCPVAASFNYKGETTPVLCKTHAVSGMINLKDTKCLEPDCGKIPSFNVYGQKKALYCRLHKKPEMVNVREKTCKIPLCMTQVGNARYDGYCLNCYMHLFPDKPVARNYKTKEKAVREFLASTYADRTWSFDARMAGGISLRRPDAVLDLSSHAIIVEVDENQHITYDCTCENKRLMELSSDLGHKPMTFIRFNPDSYVDLTGKTAKTCWKLDGNNILRVHKEEMPEWETRLSVLKDTINYWIEHPTDKTANVIQLYYDSIA